jgi:hypothetical protein
MAIYDNTYGLPQSMIDYLNQGLPDISGINTGNFNPIIPVQQAEGIAALPTTVMKQGTPFDNPYSIDPDDTNIRTIKDYRARPAYEAAFGEMMGDPEANIATGALNSSGVMGPYQEKPKSELQEILGKMLPGKGVMDLLKQVLPVNRTGIMQNEMLGSGIMLDNLGRIVAAPGKYNTREGIMAGYNLSARPQDFESDKNVYNKRTKNITETLLDKYKGNITREQIQEVIDEIEETGEYTGDITDESIGAQNLFSNLVNVNKSKFDLRNIQKNSSKIRQDKQDKRQKIIAKQKGQTFTGDRDKQNIVDKRTGRRDATGGDVGSKGASDRFENKSGRGRTGY